MRFGAFLLLTCTTAACGKTDDASIANVRSLCLDTEIPADTELHIIGVYGGGDKGDVNEPVFGDDAPGKITLSTSADAPPMLYVLSAYDKVTWDFAQVPAERLAGVIAYGYEVQTLKNMPVGVPVAFGTFRDRRGEFILPTRPECGGNLFAYNGGPELEALVDQAEKSTGLKVNSFYGEYSPISIDLDNLSSNNNVAFSPTRPVTEDTEPGADRLKALVAAGVIRPAQQSDVDAWNAVATRRLKSGKFAPFVSERLRRGVAYVVLKEWAVPKDMAGAYSRAFIVPSNVKIPTDLSGHNALYIMKDGSCLGATADCTLKTEQDS
jgi:hypothetical protein